METATLELVQELTIENKVAASVRVFDSKKQELTLLASESTGIRVTDINDKKQLEAVSTQRKKLKAARVAIENQGKDIRKNIKTLSDQITAKEKELVGIIEPVEDELQGEENRVQAEKDRIATEAQEREKQRILDRVQLLTDNGCMPNGIGYAIGELSIAQMSLVTMDDVKFTGFVQQVMWANAERIATEAEHKRQEEEALAERERLRIEEEQRIITERAELEQFRKESQERQAAIDAENKRISDEQAARQAEIDRKEREIADAQEREKNTRISVRTNQLIALGMSKKGDCYSYNNHLLVSPDLIEDCSQGQWDDVIADRSGEIEKMKQKANEEQKIAEQEAKAKRLAEIEAAKEQARKDEAEKIRLENIHIQAQKEAEEAEKIRQAAIAPDKDKLLALSDAIGKLAKPTLESDVAKAALVGVNVLLTKVQIYISRQIKSL